MSVQTILGIDTSTDNCSVGLIKNGKLIAARSEIAKSAHSEKLIHFIQEVLAEANTEIASLTAIGINIGPGSFTGLRIGLSTAKGLAYPSGIPIIPVKSLPVLIRENNLETDYLYFIKSHKNMVFFNHFTDPDADLTKIEIVYESIDEIAKKYPAGKLIGNFDFLENFGEHNKVLYPTGQAVAEIVSAYYSTLKKNIGQKIEPYYLTSFQAQKWRRNK